LGVAFERLVVALDERFLGDMRFFLPAISASPISVIQGCGMDAE
jgi:hypothetical protein